MTKPEDLPVGQVLISAVRGTSEEEKVQLEFCQHITASISPLALANKDDERFAPTKPRRAWLTGSAEVYTEYFPEIATEISLVAGDPEKRIEVSVLNPQVNGEPWGVQVTESTLRELVEEYENTSSKNRKRSIEYLLDNVAERAKKNNSSDEGMYLLSEGQPIFSETNVVLKNSASHRIVKHDAMVKELTPGTAVSKVGQTLAPPVEV